MSFSASQAAGVRMLNVSTGQPSARSASTSRRMKVCDAAGYWLVR
jgi:hypothetical protein